MERDISRAEDKSPVVRAAVRASEGATLHDLGEALGTYGVPTPEGPWQTLPLIITFEANITLHHQQGYAQSPKLVFMPFKSFKSSESVNIYITSQTHLLRKRTI